MKAFSPRFPSIAKRGWGIDDRKPYAVAIAGGFGLFRYKNGGNLHLKLAKILSLRYFSSDFGQD